MSLAKEFIMTLAATTVSILLTFGTTAIIDRHKKNAEIAAVAKRYGVTIRFLSNGFL